VAAFVTLYRYTDEGIKGIKNAGEIARAWQQEAEKRGVTVRALYWLQGAYDALTIVESDNEDAVNGLLLAIGSQGLMRTETTRAFSLDDIERIAKQIG
jgi:uncharacterized protein with GYD domain